MNSFALPKNSLIFSGGLHFFLLLVVFFGLPQFGQKVVLYDQAVPFDVVLITEKANLKPEPKKPDPIPAPPPTKPKPEAFSQPAPVAPPEVKPEITKLSPEKLPEAKVEEPVPTPDLVKPVEAPSDPAPADQPRQQLEESAPVDFSTVLKTVEDLEQQAKPQVQEPDYNALEPLSITYIQAIQRQLERCWTIPAGAVDAENLVVEMELDMNPDGTVQDVRVLDNGRQGTFYMVAKESAVRAVLNPQCNPLPVPLDQYEKWKNLKFTFNPRGILGY